MWVASRAQERKTMSQDPQGRSLGSLEWEAMRGDPFPDTSQDLEKTGQGQRERERRMK